MAKRRRQNENHSKPKRTKCKLHWYTSYISLYYFKKYWCDLISVTLEGFKFPEVSTKGVVLVTGAGDVGQLGLGPDVLEKSRPAVVNIEHEIVDVCAGGMHTVCLTADGKVSVQNREKTVANENVLGFNFWMQWWGSTW